MRALEADQYQDQDQATLLDRGFLPTSLVFKQFLVCRALKKQNLSQHLGKAFWEVKREDEPFGKCNWPPCMSLHHVITCHSTWCCQSVSLQADRLHHVHLGLTWSIRDISFSLSLSLYFFFFFAGLCGI